MWEDFQDSSFLFNDYKHLFNEFYGMKLNQQLGLFSGVSGYDGVGPGAEAYTPRTPRVAGPAWQGFGSQGTVPHSQGLQ